MALCGCALFLWGCNVPPRAAPGVTEIQPAELGLGSDAAPALPQDWWTLFHDPQADRLAAQMLQSNPTLQIALARLRGAQAELAGAGALRRPQINLDGQIQETLLSDEYVLPTPYGGSWREVEDIQARLTWSLDFWGKQAALIEKARSLAVARELDRMAAQTALAGAFAQAYIGLLTAWQDIDIARQTVAERQAILQLAQSRADAGLENEAALEQARALLAAAEVDLMGFETGRDLAVHAVAALTGQGASAYAGITRPAASLDAALPLPRALPADLLARRPDILAARARVTAALHGQEAAHADFYPNIDLTAALGLQAVGVGNFLSPGAITTGVGPAIHLPLFDAGKLRAQYAVAGADLDAAIGEYNAAVLAAVRQAADSLSEVESLAARRPRQQAVLDSAERAFRLAEERYRLGLSDQIVVLNAEGLLLQARRQMAALEAEAATRRVTLLLAVGGGVDPSSLQQARQEGAHDD
jgi:NodT family efflux transporter outer membrane factor (OMF) lipoprotein